MKLFAPRHPIAWGLLIAAILFAVLGFTGLASGEGYMLGGRGSSSQVILAKKEPARYFRLVYLQLGFATLFLTLGFIRIVPIEDYFVGLKRTLQARLQNDRTPAPIWAYVFLVGSIALVVWVGWITMYSQ